MFSTRTTQKPDSRLAPRSLAALLCLVFVACGSQFAPKADTFHSEFVAQLSTKFAIANSQSALRALPPAYNTGSDGDIEATDLFLLPHHFTLDATTVAALYSAPQRYIASRDRYRLATPRDPPSA